MSEPLTLDQHLATIESWVQEAAADQGMDEDEVYSDMVWNYVVSTFPSENHPMAREIRRCTGTQARSNLR